jgi:hypothetical protein
MGAGPAAARWAWPEWDGPSRNLCQGLGVWGRGLTEAGPSGAWAGGG